MNFLIWIFASLILQVGNAEKDVPFSRLERENVKMWATDLGMELWDLGQTVTRATEMKTHYQKLNVRVQKKDGEELLKEIADNVQRMLDRKMDAVKCIMYAAEEEAESFNRSSVPKNYTFYSAKYSYIVGEEEQSPYVNHTLYTDMYLSPHRHFYNIPVNMSHSAVHVPTNVYDFRPQEYDTIKWSEALDEVFIRNFNSDPALSFQYFGSLYGLMRSYPAMKWRADPDLFDCRNRYWYIEAATCTKDIVILMDNSGSMAGYRNTIAKLTVSNILDTLNNNDFVNVFNYSEVAIEAVPCFKDLLVQATIENVDTLKEAVNKIKPEGHANLTYAFNKAFDLLEKYRELRGCSRSSSGLQCNQAIMLVTDGVAGNITEVFQYWNWQENSTFMPVRVFTYLIGKEVTKVKEIQLMACLNKGYYVHIHTMHEVREQVIKYIPVIARPLVLQGLLHPTIWTPAYADTADPTLAAWLFDITKTKEHKKRFTKHALSRDFSQGKEDHIYIRIPGKQDDDEPDLQEYRTMISVAIPVFNRKLSSSITNETRLADLLGVAGTDMPIKDMEKLTYNYKSGVNGYAFILTNNGYVLLHPDLRPVFRGVLKKNYNSVDLTEIELLDDGSKSREVSPEIVELRNAMVNHSEGKILGLRMKFHYDDIRRVAVEYKNYYFTPLMGTPFSLGLSLPEGYGSYYINPGHEVQKNVHKKVPIISFLKGSPWRIHPDWIYCKYHHQQTHVFETPEDELIHFLNKMGEPGWVWREKYEKKNENEKDLIADDSLIFIVENSTETVDCNRRILGEDEYYCDAGLIQLFTFDAQITDPFFRKQALKFRTVNEEKFVNMYNITLKFVSTQSGLTRWLKYREDVVPQPHPKAKEHKNNNANDNNDNTYDDADEDGVHVEEDDNDVDDEEEEEMEEFAEFGDIHTHSIDEPWYRSAVLQHELNPKSYVFTVPFDAGFRDDALVMASHAIYPRDGGLEAPASVVGYQFLHSSLYSRFMSITSKTNCRHCHECASEELDCYVLDHNGYVVLSENHNSTGRFFGEVEGAVMDSLRSGNSIYRKIPMYDYQGMCFDEKRVVIGAANFLLTPFTQLKLMVQWIFGQILWLLIQTNLSHLWYGIDVSALSEVVDDDMDEDPTYTVDDDADHSHSSDSQNNKEPSMYDIPIFHQSSHELNASDPDSSSKVKIEIIQIPRPCDKRTSLYLLQDEELDKYKYTFDHCSRPHLVERIPHTNLVLVVIKSMYQTCPKKVMSSPIEVEYNGTEHPCQKLLLNNLPRRRLSGCFSDSLLEPEVKLCGDCDRIEMSIAMLFVSWCVVYIAHFLHQ